MKNVFFKVVIPLIVGTIGIVILINNYSESNFYKSLEKNGVRVKGQVVKTERVSMGTTGDSWYIWVRYLNDYLIHNEITVDTLNVNVGDSLMVVYQNDNPSKALLEIDLDRNFFLSKLVGFLMSFILLVGMFNFYRIKN